MIEIVLDSLSLATGIRDFGQISNRKQERNPLPSGDPYARYRSLVAPARAGLDRATLCNRSRVGSRSGG